jgi:hypothetical protein
VDYFVSLYQQWVEPSKESLRKSVIYGDANDHNVLVNALWPQPSIAGVIDFGDMHHGWIASEAAVASAYAVLGKEEPLTVMKEIVGDFGVPLKAISLPRCFAGRNRPGSRGQSTCLRRKPADTYITSDHGAGAGALRKSIPVCALPLATRDPEQLWLTAREWQNGCARRSVPEPA